MREISYADVILHFNEPIKQDLIYSCRYSGGGFVKKSFPFPKLSLQRRRRLMALGSSRERMLRKHKKREKSGDNAMGKSQGVREARYRKARKLLKNAIAKVEIRLHHKDHIALIRKYNFRYHILTV